jgi:hypothetical protein
MPSILNCSRRALNGSKKFESLHIFGIVKPKLFLLSLVYINLDAHSKLSHQKSTGYPSSSNNLTPLFSDIALQNQYPAECSHLTHFLNVKR